MSLALSTLHSRDRVNIVEPGRLHPAVSFARASTATYMGPAGTLLTAAANAPRYEYDGLGSYLGLLIEEARTNISLRSAEIDNVAWNKSSVTVSANTATAPDGTTSMDLVVPSATAANHNVLQSVSKAASSITYTCSVYAKASSVNFLGFRLDSGSINGVYAVFDLLNGLVATAPTVSGSGFTVGTASITAVGGGIYRCVCSYTTDTLTITRAVFVAQNANGNPFTFSYTGNGTDGIYLWGAQFETGAFATSYIPTTSAAVTRSADVATITSANFFNIYSSVAGTFILLGDMAVGLITNAGLIDIYTDFNNKMSHRPATTFTNSAGVTTAAVNRTGIYGSSARSAFSYASGSLIVAQNGALAGSTGGAVVPSSPALGIGNRDNGAAYLTGHIKSLTYLRRQLPGSELQRLTA